MRVSIGFCKLLKSPPTPLFQRGESSRPCLSEGKLAKSPFVKGDLGGFSNQLPISLRVYPLCQVCAKVSAREGEVVQRPRKACLMIPAVSCGELSA